jgi:hypothetical protein
MPNVIVNQKAVSDYDAKIHVTCDRFGGDYLFKNKTSNTVEVECIALDTYVRAGGIHRIDYIKIDVEGAELLVLRGAIESITRFKPIIQLETCDSFSSRFDYKSADVFEFLLEKDYDYFFLGVHEDMYGVGKLQPSTGDIFSDMKRATEFFFFPKDTTAIVDYDSKYSEPLRHPYI